MQADQANEVLGHLDAARAEADKLAASVTEHETALQETRDRLEAATARSAFAKAQEDGEWAAHLLELARKRVEQHRIEVLTPLEIAASQAQREQEAAAVLAARTDSEKAFAHAGELARDAVRAIAAAIESLGTLEQVRRANLAGAGCVSLSSLRADAVVSTLNGKIGAEFTRYIQMHAAGGELQLRVTWPLTVPQSLR